RLDDLIEREVLVGLYRCVSRSHDQHELHDFSPSIAGSFSTLSLKTSNGKSPDRQPRRSFFTLRDCVAFRRGCCYQPRPVVVVSSSPSSRAITLHTVSSAAVNSYVGARYCSPFSPRSSASPSRADTISCSTICHGTAEPATG